jgi:hypothetical protein
MHKYLLPPRELVSADEQTLASPNKSNDRFEMIRGDDDDLPISL